MLLKLLGQAKLIHSLSSSPACVFEKTKFFIIHYSSLNNHFPDSVYVLAVFTPKITEWGTNGMMVYPLQSSKIVSKLLRVSKKSQKMRKGHI